MNHPLVRRKFGATFFFFFPSSRGRGTAIGSWKTWKGVAVWRYTYCSFLSLSLGSLSDIPRFFLPLSLSFCTNPIFLFSYILCYFLSHFYFAYTFSSLYVPCFPTYRYFSFLLFLPPLIFPSSCSLLPSHPRSISLPDRVGN